MITHDHYHNPLLNWILITTARSNTAQRLQALQHIRAILQLNMVEAKEFLDNKELYIDPREGYREPTIPEKLHIAQRTIRDLQQAITQSKVDIAVLRAERDVYKQQVEDLLNRITRT